MNRDATWSEVVSAESGHIFIDRIQKGLRFVVLRGPGSLCAYMGVPKDHPLAGHSYDDIPLRCHGGLTYSGQDIKGLSALDSGRWWYGWDYGHAGDRATYYDTMPTFASPCSHDHRWTPSEVDEDSWYTVNDAQTLMQLAEKITSKATTR